MSGNFTGGTGITHGTCILQGFRLGLVGICSLMNMSDSDNDRGQQIPQIIFILLLLLLLLLVILFLYLFYVLLFVIHMILVDLFMLIFYLVCQTSSSICRFLKDFHIVIEQKNKTLNIMKIARLCVRSIYLWSWKVFL